MKKKAIILLSGGLDSATCLAIAKQQDYDCFALSFDYGQRHVAELNSAKKIATLLGVVEHRIISLPSLGQLGGSSLTDRKIAVPNSTGVTTSIPNTYVPARNTVFLSIALAWAEVLNTFDIFIGANQIDYSGYPDCREEYLKAFQNMANLATKATVEGKERFNLHAPLLHFSKAEIIRCGTKLGVDYAHTVSCYRATDTGLACGHCDSCRYRQQGFASAGLKDVTRYQDNE